MNFLVQVESIHKMFKYLITLEQKHESNELCLLESDKTLKLDLEMTQWVKYLLCKNEEPSSQPQKSCNKMDIAPYTCHPSDGSYQQDGPGDSFCPSF